jgi:hypothetical protein
MSYHHERADEAERQEEHRKHLDSLDQEEPNSTVRSSGFGGPTLSHYDRHVSGGVPSIVVSSGSSEGDSRDYPTGNISGQSSTSDWENSSMPGVSQMPPSSSYQQTIEISPGVHVRLRGADETWKAIENDFYMPAECICCESTIFCIQNADYILCPDCRVVSRMEDLSSHGMGGVGLGFKYEDLARWQEAIRKEQTSRRPSV